MHLILNDDSHLFRTGLRKALEVEQRDPLLMVPCGIMKPVWNSPLQSLFSRVTPEINRNGSKGYQKLWELPIFLKITL